MHSSSRFLFFLFIVLALLAYGLPWVINPGISLSLGAYDLAEWSSLHPTARATSPALITSLLLRLPLVCLALIIALSRQPGFSHSMTRLIAVLMISVALLPPFEFFTQFRDDPNYQQQFILALITLALGFVGLRLPPQPMSQRLTINLAFGGIVASFLGLIQSYSLLQAFGLPVHLGFGGLMLVAAYAGVILLTWSGLHSQANKVAIH